MKNIISLAVYDIEKHCLHMYTYILLKEIVQSSFE